MYVTTFSRDDNNIIAVMNLHLLKPMAEKGRSLQEDESREEEVRAILQSNVESGRIGALKVDPQYWVVDSGSCKFTTLVLIA